MQKIGFVGTGNMGGALISGLLKSQRYQVFVYDILLEKAEKFQQSGAIAVQQIDRLCSCDYIILTVKPNIYPSVLEKLQNLNYKNCIITVTPGFSIQKAKSYIKDARVIRTMPNTPAMVGEGMTLIACDGPQDSVADIVEIFSCVGKTAVLPEKFIDPGIALSGSSPAFVYLLINALADGALADGIPKQQAIEIAAQTVLGSAKMVLESEIHPCVLKDQVCSPGGTTIAATEVLEKAGFKNAIIDAMHACTKKATELS